MGDLLNQEGVLELGVLGFLFVISFRLCSFRPFFFGPIYVKINTICILGRYSSMVTYACARSFLRAILLDLAKTVHHILF